MGSHFSMFFDAKDYELLRVVNDFLDRDQTVPQPDSHKFFHAALHPHGINELAVSQEIRVAYAVINLLDSLEAGQMQDRINALHVLHNEVLYSAASSSFRYNTGRVLIQIMKSLVRAHGNYEEQLRLAHDFRKAASGKRRIIRKQLRRYFLLEMPEAWNQVAFDHHVHDANTKGRKSPTHLIMDAWIKGIRQLNVLYYNYVEPTAAAELLQAAEIMGITVNIGVEFQARFRGRYVQFIWEPSGFTDYRDMLAFLEEKPTQHLMRMGREASQYHHKYVLSLTHRYNEHLRHEIGKAYGVELPDIQEAQILAIVGKGQTSRTHLAELITREIRAQFAARLGAQQTAYAAASPEEKSKMHAAFDSINTLSSDLIIEKWLSHGNPHLGVQPLSVDDHSVPEVMRLLPATLIDWLTSIRTPCSIALNLYNLTVADVLELLYECDGMITHLELYNLKNYMGGNLKDIEGISTLQTAINEGSTVALKRFIRTSIKEYGCSEMPDAGQRCLLFGDILRNIPKLQNFYSVIPLQTRIGSDSTSRSARIHGMGFVFPETLPARARRVMHEPDSQRHFIPLKQDVYPCTIHYPKNYTALGATVTGFIRKLPGCGRFGSRKEETWVINNKTIKYTDTGNIATLGGFQRESQHSFHLIKPVKTGERKHSLAFLNTTVKNILKVAFGFALTLATFLYTQSWWVLAWFGPLVWFGITGYRNILQATLGGGGIRRSPLLRWNAYLSWSRLCDSLMYTGISVPLLELGVRWLFLEKICGANSVSSPLLFFSVISTVNGAYIAAHNIYRGLPQEAVIGNLLRSVLAIPVSIFYSFITSEVFHLAGWDVVILQQSATVISKLASDSVAAVIEGFADKVEFLRMRNWDYRAKLAQLFASYSRLEILLPEEDVLELLRRPKDFIKTVGQEAEDLEKTIIVNALDLMYFWMYQPRARSTLARLLPTMTHEEREIFANSQQVLTRVQEVSQLFVNGLMGRNFAKPLAFYLAKHEEYLEDMGKLITSETVPLNGVAAA